jgi:HEAT repeat protein
MMNVTPDSVRELLKSEDYGQRLSAVNQIRSLEPAIGFELIQVAIQDSNARVRYAAVSQLATLGDQDLAKTRSILSDRLKNDDEFDVQAAAADAIGALKLTDAFDELKHLYETTDQWLVEFSIIAALGELGEPRGFDLLTTAIASDNELVKTAAIGALGELGDDRAVPLLLPLAFDDDWQIRYRVAQALSRLDHPDARATLERLAEDPMEAIAQEVKNYLNA